MHETKLGKYMVLFPNRREYHILKREIWNQQIYHFKSSNYTPVIIDIGAHIGISVLYFKSLYPNCQILAFEPNPISFDILKENILINGLEDIELINKAISSYDGSTTLYVNDSGMQWDSNSSLIKGSWSSKEISKPIQVECTTLHRYVEDIEVIDMLKIDTEGVELSILKNHKNILHKVDYISVEYHPIKRKRIEDILSILRPYFSLEIYYEGKLLKNPLENKLLTIKGKKRR